MKIAFYTLPIYNKVRELYKKIEIHSNKTSKENKYTHINPIKSDIERIMLKIALAHIDTYKLDVLNDIYIEFFKLKLKIRVIYDLRIITKKGFCDILSTVGNIQAQLKGWINSQNKANKDTGNAVSQWSEFNVLCHLKSTI